MTNTMLKKKDLKLKIVVYAVSIGLFFLIMWPFVIMLKDLIAADFPADKFFADPLKRTIKVFKSYEFALPYFKNSVIVSFSATFLNVYFSSLTAYAITAYEWKLKTAFSNMITGFMMLPTTVSVIGFYHLIWKFHLINNLAMLIIPAVATPLTVFFMRMYLQATFSMEIVESGRIDGASEFRIFNQIVLPLLKPAMATQIIFSFVSNWYNSFVPTIILIDNESKTLPQIGAPALLYFIPPFIIYLICSRSIVEGIALGSTK